MRLHPQALSEAIELTAQRCWAAQRTQCAHQGLPIIPDWWELETDQRIEVRGAVTATAAAVAALESAAYDDLHPANPHAAQAALSIARCLEQAVYGPPLDDYYGTLIPLPQLDTEPSLSQQQLLIPGALPLLSETILDTTSAATDTEAWAARALSATARLLASFGHRDDAETVSLLAEAYLAQP